ncbi:hypothetical protein FNF29_05557 [Cafeteria roenbergensis]|uniref:MPN domain-containing protein n=1 Tax=Cafeteria roenbergensis TaxID=33653 RepID=A0A5A8CBQ6_CAFRO|nr:hypothetical protein FNF29_05557 [Cafeteria roenbergensis]|eukprot:KAA0150117.1 hypothetical protein FNF29_05557 [Cafeteria roenbergensis]
MSLTRVLVSESLVGSLMTQAMVSPSHESMALLLGRYEPSPGAEEGAIERDPPAVRIVTTALFPRHDRTATRVEFSAEALAAGVAEAEALAAASGDRSLRVVGWFHTHPSITIHPSHVDLRTQGECQGMGRGFVGLIASVFTASAAPCGRQALLTAFQSTKGWARVAAAGDALRALAGSGAQLRVLGTAAVQLAAEDMEAATRSPGSVDAFMSQAHWGVLVLRAFLGLSTDVVPALLRLERVAGSGWHLLYRRVALPALPPAVPAQLGWEAMTTSFATEEADASRTGAGWASGGLVTELADASADILRKRRLPRAPSAAPWLLRREEPLFVSFSAAGLPGGSAVAQVSAHDYVRFLAWGAPTVAADLETGP